MKKKWEWRFLILCMFKLKILHLFTNQIKNNPESQMKVYFRDLYLLRDY